MNREYLKIIFVEFIETDWGNSRSRLSRFEQGTSGYALSLLQLGLSSMYLHILIIISWVCATLLFLKDPTEYHYQTTVC